MVNGKWRQTSGIAQLPPAEALEAPLQERLRFGHRVVAADQDGVQAVAILRGRRHDRPARRVGVADLDPARDLPKGLIIAMFALLLFAALILLFAPAGGGAKEIQTSGAPLTDALASPNAFGGKNVLFTFVNVVGIAGLIASFYSLIYAYSRQIFALSRAGYIPRWLSLTSRRHAPWVALVVPGVIGFLLALSGQGDLLILISVFGATVSYVLMMLSHIILRYREPDLERPYKTPGGVLTSGVALVLGVAAVIAGFLVDPRVLIGAAIVYGIMIAYFAIYSRHHLVAQAPEEEFEAIERAEAELD